MAVWQPSARSTVERQLAGLALAMGPYETVKSLEKSGIVQITR